MKKVVKLKILYFSIAVFFCTLQGMAQEESITVNLKNVSLKEVLNSIESQTNYRFSYRNTLVDSIQNVSVSKTNAAVTAVLNEIFAGRNLTYNIVSQRSIVISDKVSENKKENPPSKYNGIIIDNNGEPLVGANVSIRGTTNGTTTAADGKFSIEAPAGATLQASYIGYAAQRIRLDENTSLRIVMMEDTRNLDDVVVVGYGTMRKSDFTGALANVKGDEVPFTTANFGQALAGRVAGVQVMQPNGRPGAGATIRVRGVNSLSAGSEPLYVVDGYPASQGYINPEDIETIDVLKDAASAAIYGSRGAGGVVIITTKRGNANKVSVDYDYQYSVAQLERKIQMLDAYQFRNLVIDARNNEYHDQMETAGKPWDISWNFHDNATRRANGGTAQTTIADMFFDFTTGKPVEPTANTDWQDAVYRNAPMQRHNLAITGGNDMLKYRVSAGYLDQDGIIAPSNHKRLNLLANVDAQVTKRLKAGFNYSFTDVDERRIPDGGRFSDNDGIVQAALIAYPQIPVYNPDGTYAVGKQIALAAEGYAQVENPVALAHEIDITQRQMRNNFNSVLSFEILKQLSVSANVGMQYITQRYNYYRPRTVGHNTDMPNSVGAISKVKATDITNFDVDRLGEFTVNYKDAFGAHKLDGVAGFTLQKKTYDRVGVNAKGHPDDRIHELTAHGSTPGDVTITDTRKAAWTMMSYLGRLNYSFADRYTLSGTLRTDGSSRFGPENKWGIFPSLSAGWAVSNESFYQNALGNSSTARLRASWGLSGNNNIGNYDAYQVMSQGGYPFGSSGYETAYWQGAFSDAAIGWEKTSQYNFGLDLTLFNNRLSLIGNFYISRSYDLLYDQPISAISGSTNVTTNLADAKVQNKGVDLQIDGRLLTGNFKWNIGGNISINRNKVLDMGGIADIYKNSERNYVCYVTKSGLPVGSFYGYKADGLISETDYQNILQDKAVYQSNGNKFPEGYTMAGPAVTNYNMIHAGDIKWKDANGDGRISELDREVLGDAYPLFNFGLNTDFAYKGFDLRLTFTGQYGAHTINGVKYYLWGLEGYANQLAAADQRYRSADDPGRGDIPRAKRGSSSNISNRLASFFVDDASYFRCSNVMLGYNVPSKLTQRVKIQKLRLYMSIDNAFTLTNYEGYNPEVDSNGGDNLTPGMDWGVYPLSRTFSFGLKVTF